MSTIHSANLKKAQITSAIDQRVFEGRENLAALITEISAPPG
jgi:hypothetical protein